MVMSSIQDIEREILKLAPAERERLALKVWESLVADPSAATDPNVDGAGIRLAGERDAGLDSGRVEPIDSEEFHRLTGGDE
jgi:hypothetical protein